MTIMTDGEIKQSQYEGKLVIGDFSEESLQPASYDARLGKTALISREDAEVDVEERKSLTIPPNEFALLTTYETFKLPNDIAGHIGIRSYYARRGLVLLAGIQIDPTFEGILVIGAYNASSRKLTLDYKDRFATIEFHRLSRPSEKPHHGIEEQKHGHIPKVDRDYLRQLETASLSDLTKNMISLSQSVHTLTTITYKIIVPILVAIFGAVVFRIILP